MSRHGRRCDGGGRRCRAAPHELRASPSRQTPSTASYGCVPEAPPKNPTLRSGRERPTPLTAPARHNRASGAGAHAQPEAMHAGSAPVVRLEGPLALGHDVLLVVSRISIRPARRLAQVRLRVGRKQSCCWPARSPGRPGSQPHRRLSGDCLRVLTALPLVKPGLPQRTRPIPARNVAPCGRRRPDGAPGPSRTRPNEP